MLLNNLREEKIIFSVLTLEDNMLKLEELNTMNDEDLVTAALDDQRAFSYIIDRYETRLSAYIKRLTNVDNDDLEDILQEIFIKVYLNLNDFNNDLKFSSWIYRIAHNHVISRYRKFKARPEGYAVSIDDEGANNLISAINIEAGTDLLLLKESIIKVLSSLNKKHRELLILKFLEEKNYQEISDIIKKPLGTVASRINRAKLEFKLEMEKQGIKF